MNIKVFFLKIVAVVLSIILIFSLVSCTSAKKVSRGESINGAQTICGKYIYYDESIGKYQIGKGNICINDGMIISIDDYDPNAENAIVLSDSQLIYPGLMDLHSHTECNMIQMFSDDIIGDIRWDNRFEWRNPPAYFKEYKNINNAVSEKWGNTFEDIDSDLTFGDMIALYAELQAVSGGTVAIQEDGNDGTIDYLNRHRKIDLVRSTSCGEDIARSDGLPMQSIIRLFKPDAIFSPEDESTYMPYKLTDWGVVETCPEESRHTYMDTLIDSIKSGDKTAGGYLIHLAEGRSGNDLGEPGYDNPGVDLYSRREFNTFMRRITDEITAGNISYDDVKKANISLIHACGLDLSDKESYNFIKDCGIALFWSPVSNLLLYKDTPDLYNYFDDENIMVSIGSDWSPSGSKTVWDECKFARNFVKARKDFNDVETEAFEESLLKAVTVKSAKILGSEKLGNIASGKYADLLILDTNNKTIDSVGEAVDMLFSKDERSVSMVYVGGKPVYGDKQYIDDFIHDDNLTWINVESAVPELSNKYYNITGIADAETFNKVLNEFEDWLSSIDCSISLLRSTEDPVYLTTIEKLSSRFTKN